MADSASIGSVSVEINPDAANFWAKFEAQTRTQAGKIGDTLGTQIGKQIADQIAKGIRDGLGKGTEGSPAREPGRKSGDDFAGEFERIVKTRISAALKSLPKAEIGASATEAEQKIKDIRAELQGLRDAKVGVDLTDEEAIAKLRELNERLNEIATKSPNIQVSVDAARAAAEIAAVGEEARKLAGENPTVKVDADTGGAEAKLAAVDSSARSAGSGVSLLVAAGVGIGPAIVPGAAAAVAALAAIGPAAIGAAGGVGVVALAASGVIGAVKAMGAADDQAGQSAVSLAGKQSQVAAASDAVRSAQASLANTVANAADSQRRASEAITNADLAETDANRQLAAAQQAVTQARIDATRAAEALSSRVAHNALDQRQAALDTTKAEQALAAARAAAAKAPTAANGQAVTEAELALEQQQLRVKDLATEQKQLAQDKATSDKQGVDGSTQVVSALDRVQKATEAVHKAEQATADARAAFTSQERQNEFSIQQAKQGVINAERSLQQATVSTATAGGAAMQKLQDAMDGLSPAGQRFAAFIYSLKTPLLDLRRTAEAGVLPGLQAGIEALLPILPNVDAAIGALSTEMGHLFRSAGQALAGPFWQDFFRFTVSTAIPAMDNAAHVAGNFAVGLAGLYRAFVPLGQDVGAGLLRFSQEFAAHALTLQNTAGYRAFLDYVRAEGPIVARTIGEVVQAAVKLVEAVAPLGGTSLTVIRLLAETINALPVPVLTVLAGGIGAVVLAMKGWALLQPIMNNWPQIIGRISSTWTAVQTVIQTSTTAATTAMASAGPAAGGFATALAGVKAGAQGAGAAVGSLAAGLGTGGILGIGLTAATIGVLYFSDQAAKQKQRIDSLTTALGELGQAYAKNHDLSGQSVKDIILHNDQLTDLVRHNDAYGVSVDLVAKAAQGDKQAQQDVVAALQAKKQALVDNDSQLAKHGKLTQDEVASTTKQRAAIDTLITSLQGQFGQLDKNADVSGKLDAAQQGLGGSTGQVAESTADFTKGVGDLRTALTGTTTTSDQFHTALDGLAAMSGTASDKAGAYALVSNQVAASQINASDKAGAYRDVLNGLGTATATQGPTFDALSSTFGNIATSELSAKDKADLLKQALQQLYGGVQAQNDADEALVRTQGQLTTQLDTNHAGFDLATAATGRNRDAILQNRDALEAALKQAQDVYVQDIANGVAEDVARDKHDKTTTSILNQIDPTYRNSAAVQDLVKWYGSIPPGKSTQISTPGLQEAIGQLVTAHAIQEGLSATPTWEKWQIEGEVQNLLGAIRGEQASWAQKRADGGPIHGWSPHSRADNIPAMLTAGEWVHPVAAVDYYGPGVMEAMRSRAIPREMFGVGLADGGLARWPINIANTVHVPNVAALWAQWNQKRAAAAAAAAGQFTGAGPIPAARATTLMGWITQALAIAGAPASWAGGPGQVGLYTLVMRESGGNPRSINLYDINAQHGDPSRGLAQTIGSTFEHYRDRRLPDDIYDPVANLVAAINYIRSRYGHLPQQAYPNLPPMGYDQGGYLPPGLTLAYNGTGQPETIRTADQEAALGQAGTTITIPVTAGPSMNVTELAHAVAGELAWQMR